MTIDTIFRWTVEYPGKIILCNVDCIFETEGKGVKRMAANLGEEIRQAEENSKRIIQDAKVEAARLVAEARVNGEKRIKEARQDLHHSLRQQVSRLEAEAEKRAGEIKEEGTRQTEAFVHSRKGRVDGVASWIMEEVTAKYGLS